MSVVDRERFLLGLTKSKALKQEVLDKWKAGIDDNADSKTLAKDLIGKKLITLWQAKMLLKGASRLTMGNFLLTDRIAKSEFGDSFAAFHRQLSRKVSIQYLPGDVCESKASKKKIFAYGSKLSELDHPNLLHVYDVDEEKNRIYLVSEVGNAKSLPAFLEKNPSLECGEIAKIVAGCLKGIEYAHLRGVVHSGITNDSVFVTPNGDSKLGGLTQYAVRNALDETPVTAEVDYKAMSAVANVLLDSVPEDQRESESFAELKTAILAIEEEQAASLASFEKLATEKRSAVSEMKLAPETPRAPKTKHPAVGVALAPTSSYESGTQVIPPQEMKGDGFLTSLAKRNPVALIAASVVASLLLLGGTLFAASKLVAKPDGTLAAATVGANSTPKASAKPNNADKEKSPRKKKQKQPPAKVERPNFRNTKGALSGSVAVKDPSAVTDPEANRAAIDAIFGKTKPKAKVVPMEAVTKVSMETKPVVTEPVVASTPPAEAKPNPKPAAPAATKTNAPPAAKNNPAKTVAKVDQEFLKAGEDPFKQFATMVDLPDDIATTGQISFGRLVLEKRHLLGAEILSTPNAHRSKPMFTLTRSSDDKQTWEIAFKKKRKSDPVNIAKLQKTANELKFNWLPEAAEVTAANYLRNCRIKLSTATHSHWLTLRRPMKIEGFKLEQKKGQVKVDVQIPHMPNPVAVSAVARGIPFERLNKENWEERSQLVPAEVLPNAPARMYFHKDADRFLSIDILGSFKKKLTLQAAFVIQPEGQAGVVMEDPSTIKQVCAQVRQFAQQAQRKAQQAAQAYAAKKIKKEEEQLYVSASKKATDQAELTNFYEHVVPQLVDKEIPVTITYALNDQHRIILAYTVESDETKKK